MIQLFKYTHDKKVQNVYIYIYIVHTNVIFIIFLVHFQLLVMFYIYVLIYDLLFWASVYNAVLFFV